MGFHRPGAGRDAGARRVRPGAAGRSLASAGRPAALAPQAKSVIWLFMIGGVSHVESFDPKPALNQFAGKTIAETP